MNTTHISTLTAKVVAGVITKTGAIRLHLTNSQGHQFTRTMNLM